MALIKCPECGKEISDRCISCPNCGFPLNESVSIPPAIDKSKEIEKYLGLAVNGIQAENPEQVEKYYELVLEMDPTNSKAWELEARGILFRSTLKSNKVPQAIAAATNAINYANDGEKAELALSLFNSINVHVQGLLAIAIGMPVVYGMPMYVDVCLDFWGQLLTLPCLTKEKIESELAIIDDMDIKSQKSVLPSKRKIYACRIGKPRWAEQFRTMLVSRGIL